MTDVGEFVAPESSRVVSFVSGYFEIVQVGTEQFVRCARDEAFTRAPDASAGTNRAPLAWIVALESVEDVRRDGDDITARLKQPGIAEPLGNARVLVEISRKRVQRITFLGRKLSGLSVTYLYPKPRTIEKPLTLGEFGKPGTPCEASLYLTDDRP